MTILKYGMEGYLVTLLQYALSRAGLDVGNRDGIFGRRTARAVQRFQREQGLAADGVVGKLTWAALFPYITGYKLHSEGASGVETVSLDLPVVTDDMPCSYLLTGLFIKGLAMRYPFLKVQEVGRSVMGRPLVALSLGEGRERVGFVGPHRAGDWPAVPGMLRFVEACAGAFARGESRARELLGPVTLHLLPLVDPDGVDLVTGALDPLDSFYTQAQALAAHYPDVPFPDGWESNISGVDLSLQYPAGWEAARRARFDQGFTRPGPRDYVGSEPLIAPESRAVVRWTERCGFARVLCYDEGYARWFRVTRGRPARVLKREEELVELIKNEK